MSLQANWRKKKSPHVDFLFELLLIACDGLGARLCIVKRLQLILCGRWLGDCRLMKLNLLVLLSLRIDYDLLPLLRHWILNHNLVPASHLMGLRDDLNLRVEWQLMLLRPHVRVDDELLNLRGRAVEDWWWLVHGDVCDKTSRNRLHVLSVLLVGFLFNFGEFVFRVFLGELDGLRLVVNGLRWSLLDDVRRRDHECSVTLNGDVLLTVHTCLKYLLLWLEHVLNCLQLGHVCNLISRRQILQLVLLLRGSLIQDVLLSLNLNICWL